MPRTSEDPQATKALSSLPQRPSLAAIMPRGAPGKAVDRMEQRKSEAEVALELMRLVLEQAGSRRLSPTRTLALYHLCKEAVAYSPEGSVTAEYLEDNLKKLLQ
jgi:hypothetical protein